MSRKSSLSPVSPHPPLAIVSGLLGILAAAVSSLPSVRGLGGQWLQLLARSFHPDEAPAVEASFSALYVLPFLLTLACGLMAIACGVFVHFKGSVHAHIAGEVERSQLATIGILAGGIGLWLLLRI